MPSQRESLLLYFILSLIFFEFTQIVAATLRSEMLAFLREEFNARCRPLLDRDAEDPYSYEERFEQKKKILVLEIKLLNFSAFLIAIFLDPKIFPFAKITFQEYAADFELESIYPRLLRMAKKFEVLLYHVIFRYNSFKSFILQLVQITEDNESAAPKPFDLDEIISSNAVFTENADDDESLYSALFGVHSQHKKSQLATPPLMTVIY